MRTTFMLKRLRAEGRDFLELFLIPSLAVILPWSWCFRLFRWLSKLDFLYRGASESAYAQAQSRGWAADRLAWLARRRLYAMVDHADYYLVCTRSDRWLKRHFDVTGLWPKPATPALLCTFHWGAGMWSLRHASSQGIRAHALVAPLEGINFDGRTVLRCYARVRTAAVAMILGRATIDVGASMRPALRALKQGEPLLALVDVPADQVSASVAIQFLGHTARVPKALLRLAVDQKLPLTLFLVGMRPEDGRRFLRLRQVGIGETVETLAQDIFGSLEQAIAEDPPAWHLWSESERFFDRSRQEAGEPQ